MTFIDAAPYQGTEETYRAEKRWSVSQTTQIDDPEWFYGLYVAAPPIFEFDETADMLFGTQCHGEFLEGKRCSAAPAEVLTSNGQRRGKAWDQYKATHAALECLSGKELSAVRGIRASIDTQPRIANLLWGVGPTEHAIFATDSETGLPIKGRLDKLRIHAEGLIVPDLKITSIDVNDGRKIAMHVYAMRYHQKVAWYCDLAAALHQQPVIAAMLILCSKNPPYTARAWQFNDNDLDLGRRRNHKDLLDLSRRLETGDWFGPNHNKVNPGPDGSLLPKFAFTDNPEDNPPSAYAEFMEFAAEYRKDNP